ncbi:ATP synthase F1 subunit epsilon [bacterium]|nr:ATP synthase F1 subunit epsilon [bacterium]
MAQPATEKLQVTIVTPLRELAAGEADLVQLPAFDGEMGVLPGHDYVFALLSVGALRVFNEARATYYFVAGGYAEIGHRHVRILAEVCEPVEEIDIDRAAVAQKRAEDRLARLAIDNAIDIDRAQLALRRATVRKQVKTEAEKAAAN